MSNCVNSQPPVIWQNDLQSFSGYLAADASHVTMFSNFGSTCVSENQVGTFCWLWMFKSS